MLFPLPLWYTTLKIFYAFFSVIAKQVNNPGFKQKRKIVDKNPKKNRLRGNFRRTVTHMRTYYAYGSFPFLGMSLFNIILMDVGLDMSEYQSYVLEQYQKLPVISNIGNFLRIKEMFDN